MLRRLRAAVRRRVLRWAEEQAVEAKRHAARLQAEADEAERFVVERVTGGNCIHLRSGPEPMVYCDRCPISPREGGLSWGASKRICTRRRRYSK